MNKDFFIKSVKEQYLSEGNSMYSNNTTVISNKLNNSQDKDIEQVSTTSLQKGSFCFMFYDLQGKSSNMEKFNPILVVDWFDHNSTRYLYGLSLNFLPINIKVNFFNMLFNNNIDTFEHNLDLDANKQRPISNINFTNIYKLLFSMGFEWAIRKFDITKINKTFIVSTNIIKEFITMSTYKFTGVPDDKIIDIWKSKIVKQGERQQKMIKELLDDYDNMRNELNEKYQSLDSRNEKLSDSINIIKNKII